jgi:Zn-dependent protease with chaperone function
MQLVLLLLLTTPAERHAAFDQKITDELSQQNPAVVPLWQQANEARDKRDYAGCSRLYAEVHEKAPAFWHAVRRQCGCELQLRNLDRAVELCEQAASKDASAENMGLLALVLAESHKPGVAYRAQSLAARAASMSPDDDAIAAEQCQVSVATEDVTGLRHCTAALERIAPDQLETPYSAMVLALFERRWSDARSHLDRAHTLGLPDDAYERFAAVIDKEEPLTEKYLGTGLWGGAFWLGGMLVLLLFGLILSAAALRASRRVPTEKTGHAHGADATLRKIYRVVLWLCCGYYYISIPIVLLLVVGTGGGLIYMFFALGRIPIKLVAIIGILVIVTVGAVLKSLFIRVRDEDPGLRLDRQPRLRAVLDEVAGKVGTRAVDQVFLTPGTEIAVMERGGMMRQLRGKSDRCLIVGAGVIDGMKVGEFKAVLAHEYGHFSNQDTAGGGFALAVRRSIGVMAISLARGGAAAWYNPAWWFVRGFHRVFLRISQGASRLQEVLADRWAAFAYGSAPFERGLRHVIEKSVRFDAHVAATLREVIENQRALANLYAYQPGKKPETDDIAKAVAEALNAKPSPYDSHPAPADRLRWVQALAAPPAAPSPEDDAEVWTLIEGRDELEKQMTYRVRENIFQAHGVLIRAEEVSPSTPAQSDSAAQGQTTST